MVKSFVILTMDKLILMSQLSILKINFSCKIIPVFMLSQFISTRIEQSITVQMVEMERIRRMVDGD